MKAYREMLAVAEHLYKADPANQQAVSDYAIALTRVAAALPERESAERLAMLQESLKLLREIERVNPQNVVNRWDLSHGYSLLGDALMDSNDRAGGLRAYQESIDVAEALLSAGVSNPVPDLIGVHEKVALEAARRGDRETALFHAQRAFRISDAAGPLAKGRSPGVQRQLTPRGTAAMGLVYALLAGGKQGGVAREDALQAVNWLQSSLVSWRELQSDPAFTPPQRKEMQQVEAALAALKK